MFGVILWSDPRSGAAVIWCEDRAEIAYYDSSVSTSNGQGPSENGCFDAGDLVQFDISGGQGQGLHITNVVVVNAERQTMPPAVQCPRETKRRGRQDCGHPATVVDLGVRRSAPVGVAEVSRRG